MYRVYNNGDIVILPDVGEPVKVGNIQDDRFIVIDKDNYHRETRSLGIDEIILNDDTLHYQFINIRFHGYTYYTTRIYFLDNSVRHNLLNFRVMKFLPIKEFGLSKALRYERNVKKQYKLDEMVGGMKKK